MKAFRVSFVRTYQVDVYADTEEKARDIATDVVVDSSHRARSHELTLTDIVPLELDEEGNAVDPNE